MTTISNRYRFQQALKRITAYRRDHGLLDGDDSPASESRRNFLAVSATFGTSVTIVAAGAGALSGLPPPWRYGNAATSASISSCTTSPSAARPCCTCSVMC